jgi:ribosomal protein S18 acetylase RimI-like enzyme
LALTRRNGFFIRQATAKDREVLTTLMLDFWQFNRAHYSRVHDGTALKAYRQHLEESLQEVIRQDEMWIVEGQSTKDVAGYARTRLFQPPPYEDNGAEPVGIIDEIFILPSHRGQDLGKTFLRFLIRTLKEKGAVHIRLASYSWNTGANQLYQNLGFKVFAYSWEWEGNNTPPEK